MRDSMQEQEVSQDWPPSLAHLSSPQPAMDMVTIGEISSDSHRTYPGELMLYTMMVPYEEAEAFLGQTGEIGVRLNSGCSGTCPHLSHWGNGIFWGYGPGGARYESLVASWQDGFNAVFEPSPALLARYCLVPRNLANGTVCWDDPAGPTHDVVRVRPRSRYVDRRWDTPARVEIRREYLEDFLFQNECIAAATFYEGRFSTDDRGFALMMGEREQVIIERPGAYLDLRTVERRRADGMNQYAQVWGRRLVLRPECSPITDETDPELDWPGIGTVSSHSEAYKKLGPVGKIHFSDAVLVEFEGKQEFSIQPEDGSVTYGGQWSAGYCRRVGRNHIALELRKLYEGTPASIIRHYHRFAVDDGTARLDDETNGSRNVGMRAKELVYSYLDVADALASLSLALGLDFKPEELCGFDREDVDYVGWWCVPDFGPLFRVSPETTDQSTFLKRCLDIQKLLDRLSIPALRQLVLRLGIERKKASQLKQLRLLGTLCQFAEIAKKQGLDLGEDTDAVRDLWDEKQVLPFLDPVFALNGLRNKAGHVLVPSEIDETVAAFGIDVQSTATGWGQALDAVYDQLIVSLTTTTRLLAIST